MRFEDFSWVRNRNTTARMLAFVLTIGATTFAQPPPSEIGQWGANIPLVVNSPTPVPPQCEGRCFATHSILLHTNKVLCIDQSYTPETLLRPDIVLLDLATGDVKCILGERDPAQHWLFCSGHCKLADGRVLLAGGGAQCGGITGSIPPNLTTIFDPVTETLSPGPAEVWCTTPDPCGEPTEHRRWYPTCTLLEDSTVLITQGDCFFPDPDPQFFTPVRLDLSGSWTGPTPWNPMYTAAFGPPIPPPHQFELGTYPMVFQTSDTFVFATGSETDELTSRRLDPSLEQWVHAYQPASSTPSTSSVMFRKDEFLKAGGH